MTKLDFPDTPSTGEQFGSSGTVWRWDGTRWASTAGTSGARGKVAFGYTATNQALASGNTMYDVAGCTLTFNVVAGRTYRMSGRVFTTVSGGGQSVAHIKTGAGTTIGQDVKQSASASGNTLMPVAITTPAVSGSVTYKLCVIQANTGNLWADPTDPAFLLVEDITYEAGTSSSGPVEAHQLPRIYKASTQTPAYTTNGQVIDHTVFLQAAPRNCLAQVTVQPWLHTGAGGAMNYSLVFRSNTTGQVESTGTYEMQIPIPQVATGDWFGGPSTTMTHTLTAGTKPSLWVEVFVATPGRQWYYAATVTVVEYPT